MCNVSLIKQRCTSCSPTKKIVYKHLRIQHERINHCRKRNESNERSSLMYPHEHVFIIEHIFYYDYYIFEYCTDHLKQSICVACFRWDTRCTVMSRVHPFCDDHISSLFNLTLHAQMKCFWWNIVNYKRITSSVSNR